MSRSDSGNQIIYIDDTEWQEPDAACHKWQPYASSFKALQFVAFGAGHVSGDEGRWTHLNLLCKAGFIKVLCMYYRLNEPDVIEETIDGEAVIVNLSTGSYYSTEKLGACVWSCLATGYSRDAVVEALSSRLGDASIAGKVDQFIADLLNEAVVIAADEGAPTGDSIGTVLDAKWVDGIDAQSLVLNKYSDMEELLKLDPIHDVDKMGWPERSAD